MSTTNSLNIVVKFAVTDNQFIYKTITETYFRYGTERLLNWHYITEEDLYLSYYN